MGVIDPMQEIIAKVDQLSRKELIELAQQTGELEKKLSLAGPQTDDELHAWCKEKLGLNITRVACCDNHQAPFQFLADLYFERTSSAVLMANRGGGKTFLVAVLHLLNSKFKNGCFAKDVLVDCPRDYGKFPGGIPISEIKEGQLVWTFNPEKWMFELKRVQAVIEQPTCGEIWELELDNGSIIKATDDHPFMLRNGEWAELKELRIGDSLMALYRDWEPYVRVRPDGIQGRVLEFNAVSDLKYPNRHGSGNHVHHIDDFRANTSEENLELLSPSEHASITFTGKTPSKSHAMWDLDRFAIGHKGGLAKPPLVPHTCEKCGEEYKRMSAGKHTGRCEQCKIEKFKCPVCGTGTEKYFRSKRRTCSGACGQKMRAMKNAGTWNHKIVAIRNTGIAEPVWDLEIEHNHNFVVSGVVVHNCESATIGAIEAQARRAYAHLQKMVVQSGDESDIAKSVMSETRWKNGSRVEVLAGTISAVNGPHPQKVHFDEVELADPEVFDESRNMSQGKVLAGRKIRSQDIITSTRKRASGMMQGLIDEIYEAKLADRIPPYELYQWCAFDIAENQPSCRYAFPDLPEDEKCDCHKVVKGRWDNGQLRTFESVCKGRLGKSDGFLPLDDLINTFTKTSVAIWEAQQECSRPSTAGLVLPTWTREKNGLKDYVPDPDNGPIYMSVDFGGTNPFAVEWFQLLNNDVEAQTMGGKKTVLPEGSIVFFDEIYIAEVGNVRVAEMIHEKEDKWKKRVPRFHVRDRFPDPQAKAARLDWATAKRPIKTQFHSTRDVKEHIKLIAELVEDDMLYADLNRCEMFGEEIESWHYPKKKPGMTDDPEKPVEDFDHAMAAMRYGVANAMVLHKRLYRGAGVPATAGGYTTHRAPETSIPRSMSREGNRLPASEKWRMGLGSPVTS